MNNKGHHKYSGIPRLVLLLLVVSVYYLSRPVTVAAAAAWLSHSQQRQSAYSEVFVVHTSTTLADNSDGSSSSSSSSLREDRSIQRRTIRQDVNDDEKESVLLAGGGGLLVSDQHKGEEHQEEESQQLLNYSVFLLSLRWRGDGSSRTSSSTRNRNPSSSASSSASSSSSSSAAACYSPPLPFSKAASDVWRWKDAVLGDGRDFFVSKPRTLAALQRAVSLSITRSSNNRRSRTDSDSNADVAVAVDECVFLSNCARLEILLVVRMDKNEKDNDNNDIGVTNKRMNESGLLLLESLKRSVSEALLHQVDAYQQRRKSNPLLELQLAWADSPDWIADNNENINNINDTVNDATSNASASELVRNYWTAYTGPLAVARHWCRVAAGTEPQPRQRRGNDSRPASANTLFRPFSSRDAHIMLQLKRTLENTIASTTTKTTSTETSSLSSSSSNSSNNNVCSTLLRYALQAGKAARNPDKVPELVLLRGYGTGDNSKYAMEPPLELTLQVQEAATRRVIDPTALEAVQSLMAQDQAVAISEFRRRAQAMASTADEELWIRKLIHQPTLELRKGNNCGNNNNGEHRDGGFSSSRIRQDDVDTMLQNLSFKLEEHRRHLRQLQSRF